MFVIPIGSQLRHIAIDIEQAPGVRLAPLDRLRARFPGFRIDRVAEPPGNLVERRGAAIALAVGEGAAGSGGHLPLRFRRQPTPQPGGVGVCLIPRHPRRRQIVLALVIRHQAAVLRVGHLVRHQAKGGEGDLMPGSLAEHLFLIPSCPRPSPHPEGSGGNVDPARIERPRQGRRRPAAAQRRQRRIPQSRGASDQRWIPRSEEIERPHHAGD